MRAADKLDEPNMPFLRAQHCIAISLQIVIADARSSASPVQAMGFNAPPGLKLGA